MKKVILILLVMAFGPATAGLLSHAVAGYAGYEMGKSKATITSVVAAAVAKTDSAYCGSDSTAILIQLDCEQYQSVFFDRSCGKVVRWVGHGSGCDEAKAQYLFPLDYIKEIYPDCDISFCRYTITGGNVNITATAKRKAGK